MNEIFSTSRFPTSYARSLHASCLKDNAHQPHGLKSYDWHKLMHHLLPLALQACVCSPKTRLLCQTIYDLSNIFWYVILSIFNTFIFKIFYWNLRLLIFID